MDISSINQGMEQLTNILLLSAEQSTRLTEKLIKVNVEQKLRGMTEDHPGTMIDTYA
ncbi:MAG: hypothetical protein JXB88_13730 [Spirochaetales bacterium]|nr:hypothetical protein [Spirochaetales bacterium]